MTKTAVLILGLIAVLIAGYWWNQKQQASVDPVLKTIVDSHLGRGGVIEDPTNELGVKGKDDVDYTVEGHSITVRYGKQQFRIKLDDDGLQSAGTYLRALGLSIRINAVGKPFLLYKGEEVERVE